MRTVFATFARRRSPRRICASLTRTVGERIPMVVNPIPANPDLNEYVVTVKEKPWTITTVEKMENMELLGTAHNLLLVGMEPEEGDHTVYIVYDSENDREIYRTSDEYKGNYTNGYYEVDIAFKEFFLEVQKEEYNGLNLAPVAGTIEYYTYTGEKIVGADWSGDDASGMSWNALLAEFEPESETVNEVVYYTFYDDRIWAFDEY